MTKKMPKTGGRHVRSSKNGSLRVDQEPTKPAPPPDWSTPAKPKAPKTDPAPDNEGDKA